VGTESTKEVGRESGTSIVGTVGEFKAKVGRELACMGRVKTLAGCG
jgi:hypothetical protein